MWIRLFTYVSGVLFMLSINKVSSQISIHTTSDDSFIIHKTTGIAHKKLNVRDSKIPEFHNDSQEQIKSTFLINELIAWDLSLTRLADISASLDLQIINDPSSPVINSRLRTSRYKGSLIGSKNSSVYLTVVENKFELVIYEGDILHHISWSDEENSYIYKESDRHTKNNSILKCASSRHETIPISKKGLQEHILKSSTSSCQEINLQFYTDHLFHEEYQSIENGLLKILSTVTQIQDDFDPFNIQFTISSIQFSTCAACDPWSHVQDASNLLYDFKLKTNPVDDNSIKILLTGRSLDNLFVGLAYFNSFCTADSKVVIQDVPLSTWQQRVILSHEIGHVLGNSHDDTSDNIMSSSLRNTSDWTQNSQTIIQNKISNSACLNNCSDDNCPQITAIEIAEKSSEEILIEWSSDVFVRSYYELVHLETNELKDSGFSESQISLQNLQGCEEYELTLYVDCENGESKHYSKIISTSAEQEITISRIDVVNCDSDNFDLKLYLTHNLTRQQDITVTIGNIIKQYRIRPLTRKILIHSLSNYTQQDATISLSIGDTNNNLCASKKVFDMPENDCSINWIERFDNGPTPDFWSITNSNQEFYTSPYSWKFDDSNREIGNYDYSHDAINGTTINGTRMVYMDDDYLASNSYTGTTTMLSPQWDLRHFDDITISFDYIFHKFVEKGDNDSHFKMYAWSGSRWIEVFNAAQTNCPWHKIWESHCSTEALLDLSNFNHHSFQLQFVYSDGNDSKWTGMAAFDDFHLIAKNKLVGCLDPEATNYNSEVEIHAHNVCTYECDDELITISSYPAIHHVTEANRIEATGTITQSDVTLTAQAHVTLNENFSIEMGSTISIEIDQCSH